MGYGDRVSTWKKVDVTCFVYFFISQMFDENTLQHLWPYYVYLLIDPKDNKCFYVWKWSEQRVFNHVKCALEKEEITDKYEKIREITKRWAKVKHIIVRHGLTQHEAHEVEASIMDTLDYLESGLTNIACGHHSLENWLMTVDEIRRKYNAEPLEKIWNDCVILNINKNYERWLWDDWIYQATKETWAINKKKVYSINYVLSEYRGLIVEVFEVEKWYTKVRPYNPWTQRFWQSRIWYWFNGKVASPEIRDLYINKSISKTRWNANVIRYNIDNAG